MTPATLLGLKYVLSRLPKWNDHLLQWENGSGRRTHHQPSYRHGIDLILRRRFHSSAGESAAAPISLHPQAHGMDLSDAASISAFMDTAGSMSNVIFNLCLPVCPSPQPSLTTTLLCSPSHQYFSELDFGVVCNVMFPEWLITALFTVLIAFSTYKTFQAVVASAGRQSLTA
ncbi:hypothetical protein HPP92_017637 [Vanilla planifolia]|uniref:Uncharacterized protein n=1 Tax=Vanilla planifolia TaxID=51239 RepID=A0A835QNH4_VANPL|nr:hypothetical protein HPP92_017637 [Vanilla planifolia]